MITSLPLRREMETKNRAKSIPSKYVTLKQLQELRLKERQEEEEKPRWQKEEEERPRELEEEGEERQGIDEKAKSGNSRGNPRSNASARRKWRRNGSGRPISGPSPNSEVDGAAEAVGGSNRNPQTTHRWRGKQAETDRTKENEDDGTAKDSGAVSGSEITLQPSPESLIGGVNGRGRRSSRPKRDLQPARVIGGGPERTVEIERRFGDLRINVRDEKPAAAAERRVAAGRRGGGLGMTGRRGRWVTPAGSGMVWVRKTTSS